MITVKNLHYKIGNATILNNINLTDELSLTTVMVVHDINVAAAYADTIITMKNGKIEKIGSPQQIITNENLKAVFNLDAEVLEHQGKPLVIHHI